MNFQQICGVLFNYKTIPFDPEIAVANSVRRIIKKCDFHKLEWTLVKSRNNGKLLLKKEKRDGK